MSVAYADQRTRNAEPCQECGVATTWRIQLLNESVRKWRCPDCTKPLVHPATYAAMMRNRYGD